MAPDKHNRPAGRAQGYRLTRKFAIVGLVIVLFAAVGLAEISREIDIGYLRHMTERNNIALTRTVANSLWPKFKGFIGSARRLPAEDLRKHPQIAELLAAVRKLLAGTNVLKVKLYDTGGLTVFSTALAQIGSDYSANKRFLAAMAGRTISVLEFRERFEAMGGTKAKRWVLSSYVPIRLAGGTGRIDGVAEIYGDVTETLRFMRGTEVTEVALAAGAFLTVYVLLLAMVWYAERQIRRHHQHSLELAASAARSESASQAKSEFLANMSHELRTPLNAIIGFSEVIKDGRLGPVGEPRYKEYAADILASGQHLLDVINDVLDLTKVESGTMQVARKSFDAVATARQVVKMLDANAASAGVTLSLEAEPKRQIIESDQHKVRQILLNLASNALKFTPAGGRVTVRLHHVKATDQVELAVIDTGVGMKAADIPAALAPFSQVDNSLSRSHEGTGLGLPLSQQLSRLLGGDLRIVSRPGVGTAVTVTLPVSIERRSADKLTSAA